MRCRTVNRWRVAPGGDRLPADQLHDKVGAVALGSPCIHNPGDVGMVHERKRLAFGVEARRDQPGVHPRPDNFQGDLTANRLALAGAVHHAHAALAQALQ